MADKKFAPRYDRGKSLTGYSHTNYVSKSVTPVKAITNSKKNKIL